MLRPRSFERPRWLPRSLQVAAVVTVAAIACAGCAVNLRDYSAVSRALVKGRSVRLAIDNPEVRLRVEGFMGGPKAKDSKPPLGDYVREALTRELRAAGFTTPSRGPYDVVLRVRIRKVVGAEVIGFWLYPLPVGVVRFAGVVDVLATAHLPSSGRVFQRRFGKGLRDWVFWFFAPFGLTSPADMVHRASQQTFSAIVKAVAELLADPNGQS